MKMHHSFAAMMPSSSSSFLSQFLIVFTSTIGAIADGMQIGYSALLLYLLTDDTAAAAAFIITRADIVWLESCFIIGGIIALPLASLVANRLGAKKSIFIGNLLGLAGWTLIATGPAPAYLFVGRLLTGACSDIYNISTLAYISEISDKFNRGFFLSMVFFSLLLGTLVVYAVGPFIPNYAVCLIGISLILVLLAALPFMPETPYYYMTKHQPDEARKVLVRLRKTAHVQDELDEISSSVERQRNDNGNIRDLFAQPNRKIVIISVVLTSAVSLNNVMIMNVHEILTAAKSIYLDAYCTAIVFCICILLSSLGGSIIVDRCGRKSLLIVSSLLTALCFLVLAVYFTLEKVTSVQHFSWIPMAAVMTFAIVFKCGAGQIPFIVVAELLPSKLKAIGLMWMTVIYLTETLINIQIYNHFSVWFGFDVPFYIYLALCILVACFAWRKVPETKGKTLEEIRLSYVEQQEKA